MANPAGDKTLIPFKICHIMKWKIFMWNGGKEWSGCVDTMRVNKFSSN